jgi:hypothetical protein
MPCKSYSLPAAKCITGSKLAQIKGSICSTCYALKGRYRMPSLQSVLERRLASITHEEWVPAMAFLIGDARYFRWHDSGDIQSHEHFANICEVCRLTPHCKHWLPTRERAIVEWYLQHWKLPKNLVIRMSAVMFDERPEPIAGTRTTSGSHDTEAPIGFECRKPYQNNTCGDCRKCWDKRVTHISYKRH